MPDHIMKNLSSSTGPTSEQKVLTLKTSVIYNYSYHFIIIIIIIIIIIGMVTFHHVNQ
jgi:hypothetical protein